MTDAAPKKPSPPAMPAAGSAPADGAAAATGAAAAATPKPVAPPADAATPVAGPGGAKAAPADETPDAEEAPRYVFGDVKPAALRLRHYLLIAAFVLIVIVPTAISAWISWSFAGSLRQVTVSATVQEQSLGLVGASSTSAAMRTAFTGRGAEETAIVRQLVNSEDFFRTIRGQFDLTKVWPADLMVPYLPTHYDPDAPIETGHKFWRNLVAVNVGSRDNIIRITVTARDQERAEELLQEIRIEAERRLNLARAATLRVARAEAVKRQQALEKENAAHRQALLEFRLQYRAIDPMILAGLNSEFRDFLRSMQATEEINLATAEAAVGQSQELTRRSNARMAAIQSYMDDPETTAGHIISADEVTGLIAEYQPLVTDAELSSIALRMSDLAIMHYDRELESAKIFLTSVTGGSMATIRVFPQFGPTVLVVLLGSFICWSIVLLIFYGIRDRK